MKRLRSIIILVFLFCINILAENDSTHEPSMANRLLWINGGIGLCEAGLAVGGTFSRQKNRFLSSIFWDIGGAADGNFGFSIGPVWDARKLKWGITAGPALVWESNEKTYSEEQEPLNQRNELFGPGISAQIHFAFVPERLFGQEVYGVGLGLLGTGNLNLNDPYVSLLGTLYVGQLRERKQPVAPLNQRIESSGIVLRNTGLVIMGLSAIPLGIGTVGSIVVEGKGQIGYLFLTAVSGFVTFTGGVTSLTGVVIQRRARRNMALRIAGNEVAIVCRF